MVKRSMSRTSKHMTGKLWGWKQEFQDLMLGLAGAAIFGTPLIFTMEMWEKGAQLSHGFLLGLLASAMLINTCFGFLSGLRDHNSFPGAISDSITAIGIGILFSATVLWLIGVLDPKLSQTAGVGTVLFLGLTVSVGVTFVNSQLRDRSRSGEDEVKDLNGDDQDPQSKQLRADLMDAAATLIGSTIFAFAIAPTEEVLVIASRLSNGELLLLLCVELILCYIIMFASNLENHQVYVKDSILQHPVAETLMATSLSLVVSMLLLLGFGFDETMASLSTFLPCVVVLGFSAVVGGAAGRVIV